MWIHSSDGLFRFADWRLELFIDDLPWRDYINVPSVVLAVRGIAPEAMYSRTSIRSRVYPPCDIDKVRERGETWAVDPEMREALDRLGADLRGEIQASTAVMRAYMDERLQASAAETCRHFDVVGESLRGDIRAVAEGGALLSQRTDRRVDEEAGRTDGLEGRVLRLEVRVSSLEDGRKLRRPRRRR